MPCHPQPVTRMMNVARTEIVILFMNVCISPDSMQQRSLSDSKKISTGPNNLLPSRCAFGLVFPFVRFGRIGGNADAIAISFGRILRGIAVAGFGCLAKIDRLLLRQPRAH